MPASRALASLASLDLRHRALLLEGQIARESSVAEGLVNRRWAQLYGAAGGEAPVLVSYRRRDDSEPSKVWSLTRQCTLSEPRQKEMRLRVNHSTLVAHVAGLSTPCTMTCFTIHFNSGKLWGTDRLTLCFESGEAAAGWHKKLTTAIAAGGVEAQLLRDTAAVAHQRPSLSSPLPSPAPSTTSGADEPLNSGRSRFGPDSPSRQLLAEMAQLVEGKGAEDDSLWPRSWRSVHHTNGVTVYAEEEGQDGEGGAFMVSAVVRASPEETFKAIMRLPFSHDTRMMFGEASILEVIDSRAQVIYQTWQASGFLGRFWAPRDVVLLRTWRQDGDGSYIVLYQSTTHGGAPEHAGGGLSWRQPVRAKIQAAGYTVSPLLPKYCAAGTEGQECLVTLVVKVDLGGWVPAGGFWHSLLRGVHRPWLKPMILSVVALRDKVEQSRFVMGAPALGAGAGVSAPTPRTSYDATARPLHKPSQRLSRLSATQPRAPGQSAAGALAKPPAGGALPNGVHASTAESLPPAEVVEEEEEDNFPKPREDEEWALRGTCHSCWACPGSAGLKIRGKNYLQDKKKIAAALPMFDLHAADLVDVDEPLWHVARFLPSIKYCREPFAFIMQLMIPCSPPQSLTIVWTAPVNPMTADIEECMEYYSEDELGTVRAFFTNFKSWLKGDGKEADKRRNTKFKLIPQVIKGSWIVKQSVGTTPVLLGQKLVTRYFRGPNYFEVDVDITANTVAASVTSLVVGAITSLVVDLCVVIEGQSEEELPERLVGTVRFSHLRLKNAAYLDEDSGKIYQPTAV